MTELLTINNASSFLDVSMDTIRRWEKKGLIKTIRNENNFRLFDVKELTRVKNKLSGGHKTNSYKILKSRTRTKFTAIDLFAGAGGTALGMENAGINHVLLNEVDRHAVKTLKNNRPKWNVVEGDVAGLDVSKYKNKVDVIEGGFPCQAFSYAGNKRGFDDIRGTLFFEFARIVKEVKPKVLIGENVRGLLNHDGGKTLETMMEVLKQIGYKCEYKVLRSQYLDVPQKRERLIIIGIRKDLDLPILFPREQDYTVSLKEAIGDYPISVGQTYSPAKKRILDLIPPGGYWRDLPDKLQKEYMKASYFHTGGKTGMARRLSWDEPSLTLTCSPSQKQTERCHPEETRPLNVREYARVQTFPDNWGFSGPISAQYKQIGNAVPVNLGYHLGKAAIAMLTKDWDPKKYDEANY